MISVSLFMLIELSLRSVKKAAYVCDIYVKNEQNVTLKQIDTLFIRVVFLFITLIVMDMVHFLKKRRFSNNVHCLKNAYLFYL